MTDRKYRIGFANLSESSPFAVTVRESLQAAIAQYPDLELISRDNDLNDDRAMANAREFAEMPVDVAIFYHINERLGPPIKGVLQTVPMITIDIPITLTSYVGVNNQRSGELVGAALTEWVRGNWENRVDKVLALIDPRVLETVRDRIDYTLRELHNNEQVDPDDILHLDCGNAYDITLERSLPVLQRWTEYDRIAIVGFNEDSTLGALEAARQAGCLDRVVAVGHGSSEQLKEALRQPDTRLIGAVDYLPQEYGPPIVEEVRRMLGGELTPNQRYVNIKLLTAASV